MRFKAPIPRQEILRLLLVILVGIALIWAAETKSLELYVGALEIMTRLLMPKM